MSFFSRILTRPLITIAAALWGTTATACETALLLAIDVSNSVDTSEYRLQVDGLADALADPEVINALLEGQVALSMMQWSGADRQELSIPWTRMRTPAEIVQFARTARLMPRAFVMSDTAPGEAIRFSLRQFAQVQDCTRHVIDISGDGTPNSGTDVGAARLAAERAGVTINGIAIESMGLTITSYYRSNLITRDGFVMTARGHRDYPEALRNKLIRELARVLG